MSRAYPAFACDAPIPHRKVLRLWLRSVGGRSTGSALWRVALDTLLLASTLAGIVAIQALAAKLLLGLIAGFVIGRLFILGHDACHHSLTPHRRLNAGLGRLLMLPSLTPYSLWDVGHNVVHHGYTNLKDFDFVWQPRTLAEYRALPAWRRRLERIYRSGWAPGLYYMLEIWWRRMYFPRPADMPTRRRIFRIDSLLVTAFALLWMALLAIAAWHSGQSVLLLLATGFVLPQLVWNAMIGFVVYIHHTHTRVVWHADKPSWSQAQPFVSTTVHVRFAAKPSRFDWGALMHHINEHTAHHVDMTIPLYRLRQAQKILEDKMPGRIVTQRFSWRWYFATARRCKLYDYRRRCWLDFSGRPTTAAVAALPA